MSSGVGFESGSVVALDLDGVLVDMEGYWRMSAVEKFPERDIRLVDPNAYFLGVRYSNITEDEAVGVFDGIDWGAAPVIHGALDAIEDLVDAGCEVHIVTASPQECREDRIRGLRDAGFPMSEIEVHFTGFHGDKEAAIRRVNPNAFVDDLMTNLHAAHRAGVPNLHLIQFGYSEHLYNGDIDHVGVMRHKNVVEAVSAMLGVDCGRYAGGGKRTSCPR